MSEPDWRRLRGLTAREIVSALLRDGFARRTGATSHQRFHHPDGRRVTVTFHRPGDTFAIGTLRSIIATQARWTEDDLRRLKLVR